MLRLNDVQKQILLDLRGMDADTDDEPELPMSEEEIMELETMAIVCEDAEIREEILSMVRHADE